MLPKRAAYRRRSGSLSPGAVFDAVVGGLESGEFKRQSSFSLTAGGTSGVQTRYEEIPGTNHFTVIDALADPRSAMVARVAALSQSIKQ